MDNNIKDSFLKSLYISLPILLIDGAIVSVKLNFLTYTILLLIFNVSFYTAIAILAYRKGLGQTTKDAIIQSLIIGLIGGILINGLLPLLESGSKFFYPAYKAFLYQYKVVSTPSLGFSITGTISGAISNAIVATIVGAIFGKAGNAKLYKEQTI